MGMNYFLGWWKPILVSMCVLTSCKSENSGILPVVETKNITEITQSTAISGGIIVSDGDFEIISKGVCYGLDKNLSTMNQCTNEGIGNANFESSLIGLEPNKVYHVRAYATNINGTAYGEMKSFKTLSTGSSGQIIADHSIVDRFDDIPIEFINEVKKMWMIYAGESHSRAIRDGLELLEALDSKYQVITYDKGTPLGFTNQYLRASRATWGDYSNTSGWIYTYGENDWFTNPTALSRTKAGITYANSNNLTISAIGFGWCWDDVYSASGSTSVDPVYGVHWFGQSINGPEGNKPWGLDAGDYSNTGNSVCLDTYLNATQEYMDYCKANGYATKVFFTTGPVDTYYTGERGYQAFLKHERTRNYVKTNSDRILFDYADILCYDDNGNRTTETWNGNTYPKITPTNGTPEETGHISNTGALRLAKAMWWMLARIAGWDGK